MKKGIIFDMDGTLWDSAENVAISWNIAIEKAGLDSPRISTEDMYSVMGKTMDDIADILFSEIDKDTRKELLAVCCQEENLYLSQHGGVLYPKLKETLEVLQKDYKLYIVSNCQAGYIEAFLEYYGYGDFFDDIECFGNNGKPKADNISLVVKRCGLEDAVYVGDIQGDYDSSKKAGIKFIHAAYGFGTIDENVPAISELGELPEVIRQVL